MQFTIKFIAGILLTVSSFLVMAAESPYDRIMKTGIVKIGYREASFPFSFNTPEKTPSGYSVELCEAALREMGKDLKQPLSTQYVAVSPTNRIDKITAGEIDLECGTTTITKERQASVDFSLMIFVTGVRALIKPENSTRVTRDLAGQRVAIVDGTSARKVLEFYTPHGIEYVLVKNYKEGVQAVADGSVVAFAGDELLIAGALDPIQAGSAQKLIFSDINYSADPYAVMFNRGDPRLLAAFNLAVRRLYESGEAERLLVKWLAKINLGINTLTRDALIRPATMHAMPF